MTRLASPSPWLRWATVAFVASGIFVASIITPPGDTIPQLGPLGLVGLDKWLHTIAYAGLGFVLFFALLPPRQLERALAVAVVVAAVYGIGIELVQWPLPARSADPVDAVVNVFGAGLGGLGSIVIRRLLLRVPRLCREDVSRPE